MVESENADSDGQVRPASETDSLDDSLAEERSEFPDDYESEQIGPGGHLTGPESGADAPDLMSEVPFDDDDRPDQPIDEERLIASFEAGEDGDDFEEERQDGADSPMDLPARDYDPELDDFGSLAEGEAPTREELAAVPPRISREQRGRQIALQLAEEYGWERAGVELLTSIFAKHWWSSAQSAMRRLLEAGITLKELTLADQIRDFWFAYQEFADHIDYQGNKTARYRTLPWTTTFDLVRVYDGYPDVEEIEAYLFDAYQTWSDGDHLRDRFPAFYKFLRHILDHHEAGDMLPPAESFS